MPGEGRQLFLAVLYAAVRAANAVPELRRRIRGDRVVEYDRCPSSHTVALPDGTYCYCRLEADRPFGEFLPYAAAEQARVKEAPSLEDGESLFFVSCVPWLSYTALTQPTPTPADSNPRITWGRWHRQEVRKLSDIAGLDAQHQKTRATTAAQNRTVSGSRFNNFSQRTYDYDKLEQQLLNQR